MKVDVCVGSRCMMMGAERILDNVEALQADLLADDFALDITAVPCQDVCKGDVYAAPVVIIDGEVITNATSQMVMARIMEEAQGG